MWVLWTIRNSLTTVHMLAFEYVDLTPFWNQFFVNLRTIIRSNYQTVLPLVSLPKLTTPDTSARIACSFGLRASNKSATRGRPPVISRVRDVSCGTTNNVTHQSFRHHGQLRLYFVAEVELFAAICCIQHDCRT